MQQPRKYAKPEFERRFLLERLPDEVSDPVRIRDRYLHHSRLRLRVIEDLGGAVLRRKLGHMTRANPNDPRRDLHTSLYLNEREFDLISSLPGDDLVKVRYRHAEIPFALVDFIEEPQPGVTLLEVSFPETISMELFMPPPIRGHRGDRRRELHRSGSGPADQPGCPANPSSRRNRYRSAR